MYIYSSKTSLKIPVCGRGSIYITYTPHLSHAPTPAALRCAGATSVTLACSGRSLWIPWIHLNTKIFNAFKGLAEVRKLTQNQLPTVFLVKVKGEIGDRSVKTLRRCMPLNNPVPYFSKRIVPALRISSIYGFFPNQLQQPALSLHFSERIVPTFLSHRRCRASMTWRGFGLPSYFSKRIVPAFSSHRRCHTWCMWWCERSVSVWVEAEKVRLIYLFFTLS